MTIQVDTKPKTPADTAQPTTSPTDNTSRITAEWPVETMVLPAVRLPVPARSARMARRHAKWMPRLWPLPIWFAIVLGITFAFSEKSTGPLGLLVTFVWTVPVVGTLIGLTGAIITRRRLRNLNRSQPKICHDRLVVVVPTIGRHDTYPALERAVRSYITYLPVCFPKLRIDIVVEEGCEAGDRIRELAMISRYIRVITVPQSYTTENGTKFKARANHYVHELRIAMQEDRDDVWILHMDDDTAVGLDTATALSQFIEEQRELGEDACHLAQGMLTYPRENAAHKLTWLADAQRAIADVTVYSAFTGGGTPLAGLHGELLLVRASVEASIGWDFGPDAIVEDAQFALLFSRRYPGKSSWFAGRCYGASPASVRDFLRQRERWSWGLISLALEGGFPLRDRLYIAYSMFAWIMSPFYHIAFIMLLGAMMGTFDTVPVTMLVLPVWALNMAYAIWLYQEGLRMNVAVSSRPKASWQEQIGVVLLMPFFTLLEGVGGLLGLMRYLRGGEKAFVVIAKPV